MSTKVRLVLGGASAIGTSALGGYYYFHLQGPSIRETLKNARLISDLSKRDRVKQGQEEFKSAEASIREEIEELKDVEDEVVGGRKLEAWCSRQMELGSKAYANKLDLVKKYCLIRSVSNQLSRYGPVLLGDDEDQGQSVYWQRQVQKTPREDVGLSGNGGDSDVDENSDLPKIKSGCSVNSSKDFLASDDYVLYTKVLKWCTVEGEHED